MQLVSPPVPRESGWLCASLVTSKDRTSPSSIVMRRGSAIGSPSLRPIWCVSRLISSWQREVRTAVDFDRVFAALNKQRPDGLYVPRRGPLMNANEKRIAGFALKSRLPSVYGYRGGVEAGGLMYYGADLADSYRRVAYYVDKILKGAKPADLPVEQPKKFELVINLKTAKQIGLTIPPSVLARADKVIR